MKLYLGLDYNILMLGLIYTRILEKGIKKKLLDIKENEYCNAINIVLCLFGKGIFLAQAQDSVPPYLIILGDTIMLPRTSGEEIILRASPLIPTSTPSNKVKKCSWINIDTADWIKSGHTITSNVLIYTIRVRPEVEYNFYYIRVGKPLSVEAYQKIRFTNMAEALRKIQLPQNQSSRSHPSAYYKELWEVARWQHPNLHVVLYDKKRKSYYRYRVGLVVYCNQTHPDATQYDE